MMNRPGITKLFKEPLLHFFLIGAVLFGAYSWMNRSAQSEANALQVRITEGEAKWLQQTWAAQWQREPTREEFRGLVAEYLKEELLSREAREMGLEQNDIYVRRRLAQKVEFLVQDASRMIEPSEDDLQKFYAAHSGQYRDAAQVSFTQIYFSNDHRDKIAAALARLKANADAALLGDRLLLEPVYRDTTQQTVAALFGDDFAAAVFTLNPGEWSGPIKSGYGLHLVRLVGNEAAAPTHLLRSARKGGRAVARTTAARDQRKILRRPVEEIRHRDG